jgi:protein PsiE
MKGYQMLTTRADAEKLLNKFRGFTDKFGNLLVEGFHLLALFAIGATIVWAAFQAFITMVYKGHASVEDILLLFIYLELGAMIGIYFKTNHMPVRFLIYVAITALTRLLIGLVNVEHQQAKMDLLIVTGAIFTLSVCVLILRYGSYKFPSVKILSDPAELDAQES